MSFTPDPRQQQAIEHLHGPMLVLAGAGTGKTTVLVRRVAALIASGVARADEILAVTYSENAAAELRSRIADLTTPLTAAALNASTFHAFGVRVLREAGRGFGVLDEHDLYVFLRRRLPELELRHYTRAVNPAEFLKSLLDFFNRCHDELVTAHDYQRYVASLGPDSDLPRVLGTKKNALLEREEVLARCREVARVYSKVESMLAAESLGTFGHMILRAVQLLRDDPKVLARERARARFILIDEFQDANLAQILLAELLAGEERNVFAVGDPDQAIYRFRGATSGAFDEFVRRFPAARGVVLNANRRSGEHILGCAYAAISGNADLAIAMPGGGSFHRERLVAVREAKGAKLPPVEIIVCPGAKDAGHREEAAHVAEAIEALRAQPASRSGKPRFGVLYRNHLGRDCLVEQLAVRNIPFAVRGINALETAEVRNLLACLTVMHVPANGEALLRVAALPQFALASDKVRDELAAAPRGASFISLLPSVPGSDRVLAGVDRARGLAAAAQWDARAALHIAVAEFGFDSSHPAVSAIALFVSAWQKKEIAGQGTLAEFLAYMEYFPEAGGAVEVDPGCSESDLETVRLMTVHAAKGLEFDHVFVLRVNQGSFPGTYREPLFEFPAALQKGIAQRDSKELHRQEERRLFYVALTRARDSLAVMARRGRGKTGDPSGFARELITYRDPTLKRGQAPSFWVRREPQVKVAMAAAALTSVGIGEWLLGPPSLRLQNAKLSATAIEAYENCPLKFKLMRDWPIPGPVSGALQYGSVVHSVLKDFFDALKQGRARALDEVVEVFRAQMEDTRFDDEHQRDLYLRQGLRQLSDFVAFQAQQAPPRVLDTERRFEIRIEGVTVSGRLDRIDHVPGGGEHDVDIVDYKTGSAKDQDDADDSLQLTLYALAAQERWGLKPQRLVLYNVEDNSQVATRRDAADFEEARERVAAVSAGIAAGDFQPKREHHCNWCEYRRVCPATEQRLHTIARAAGVQ